MAKDKKEKREEKIKKKGMLKLKPEKKLKKRKAVNEAQVNVAVDESKHCLVILKDPEGELGKSGKNTLAKMKKKKLKDRMMPKLKDTSKANNKEQNSAKIKETAVSPVPTPYMVDAEGLKSEKSGKNASAKIKKKKLKDKMMPKLKIPSEADDQEKTSANIEKRAASPGDDLANQEESNSVTKKKLKKGKKKGKDEISKKKQGFHSKPVEQHHAEKKCKESIVMDKDAEEISPVDEDCSRGMKKWLMEYKESRPGIDILQQRIDDFISAHEAKLEQEKQEREATAAEGGWTVVVHQKGRKKTTDAESGITVGSVAPAAVLDKMSNKKKSKEVTMDFYRFQKREAHKNEIMMLQEKFEQDKKRIQQLRAARKFRPY